MIRFFLWCMFCFSIFVGVFASPESVSAQAGCTVVIDADRANLRVGPSTESTIVGVALRGDFLTAVSITNGFYEVGTDRWVSDVVSTPALGCENLSQSAESALDWTLTEFEAGEHSLTAFIIDEEVEPLNEESPWIENCTLLFNKVVDMLVISPAGYVLFSGKGDRAVFVEDLLEDAESNDEHLPAAEALFDDELSVYVQATFPGGVIITTNIYPVECEFNTPIVSKSDS